MRVDWRLLLVPFAVGCSANVIQTGERVVKLVFGNRIARTGRILVGSSAVILDDDRLKVLLTRRTDNGRWCLPGGALDAGESVT